MYENAFYKNDIPSLMTLFTGIPTFPENAFSDIWRPKSDTRSWHFRVGGGIPEYLPTIAPNLAKPEIFCVNFGVVFGVKMTRSDFGGCEVLVARILEIPMSDLRI